MGARMKAALIGAGDGFFSVEPDEPQEAPEEPEDSEETAEPDASEPTEDPFPDGTVWEEPDTDQKGT